MAEGNTLRLKIIAPERIFFDDDLNMVELNTTEREIGILPEHIPLTPIIAPGVLTITTDEGRKEAALMDGFIEVQKKSVTILAEACEWPDEIDAHRAQEAKIRAERRIGDSSQDENRAELALKRAMLRLQMTKK